MKRSTLLKKVKELGYPLFETEETINASETLTEVIKSNELRLWEGFPVMLATSLEKNLFDYQDVLKHLDNTKEKECFQDLVMMSLALYSYLELEFAFTDSIFESNYFDKNIYDRYLRIFREKCDLTGINRELSSARIINTFKNYFRRSELDFEEYINMKDDFELEYAMSQIFSKKQKELFLKKLRGEKLNKTEREYYSRSIKKKVLALANSDLHKLAERLIKE